MSRILAKSEQVKVSKSRRLREYPHISPQSRKFQLQGEECMWCPEELSHKRHKQSLCEDVSNKQMEHLLIKCPVANVL